MFKHLLTVVGISAVLILDFQETVFAKQRLLDVLYQKSTNTLLIVDDQFHVNSLDAATGRLVREFETPKRKPYRLRVGAFEGVESFKIQRSFDERWLAVAYEPADAEGEQSPMAIQIVIWNCRTGKIIKRSEIPREDILQPHLAFEKIDFVLAEKESLVYLKYFEKLWLWAIYESKFIHQQKIAYPSKYYFDAKTERIAYAKASSVVLRNAVNDDFLQEMHLNGLTAEHIMFMDDGRILIAVAPDEQEQSVITSPYPLLVCYHTTRRKVLWSQPFDTIPTPWQVSPDASQILVGLPGGPTGNDLKVPVIDADRVVNQRTLDGKIWPFPWSSVCTLDSKRGQNRVYRYKGTLFSTMMDVEYSLDGDRLAYIGSSGMGKANYATIVKSADWSEIATINSWEKGVEELVFLPKDQGILFWSKQGRMILHWDPATNDLKQFYPEATMPALAEKPGWGRY